MTGHLCGEDALQNYLLREVQNVYRSQNVGIDDKHALELNLLGADNDNGNGHHH